MDRLTAAPQAAKTCPNCACPYIGIRCESCKWTEPEEPVPVVIHCDGDEADEPEEPTWPVDDHGGSD